MEVHKQSRHQLLVEHESSKHTLGLPGSGNLASLVHRTLTESPVFPLVAQIRGISKRSGKHRLGYSWSMFGSDLVGSVTVAMIMIPQSIAYASLVHIPTINTLISSVFPVILYSVFGGSRVLSIGPEATISTIVGAAVLQHMAAFPGLSAVQIASALSFVIGIIMIAMSLLQAGFIDHILSGYLQTGFITGAAVLIITEQLPSILGLTLVANQTESTISQFINICQVLGTAKYPTVLLSVSNILFLLILRDCKKKYGSKYTVMKFLPEYLLLAIIMVIISASVNLHSHGIAILGDFDNQIPLPVTPALSWDLVKNLFEPAITVILVGYIEAMTVTRNFGMRSGYVPTGNRELFALGFINLVGSFFGCYPVFASLPRSRIIANCGAKSTLSNAMAGLLIFIAFVALKSVMFYIPRPMLSSIIVVSALGLIEVDHILFVFRTRALPEILMLLTTFGITLATTLSTGILLCIGFSALLIIRQTTSSSLSILGRVPLSPLLNPSLKPTSQPNILDPNHQIYASPGLMDEDVSPPTIASPPVTPIPQAPVFTTITDNPSALLLDGVLILRVDVSLMFYNCAQVRRSLETLMGVEKRALMTRRRRLRAAQDTGRSGDTVTEGVNSKLSPSDLWLVADGGAESIHVEDMEDLDLIEDEVAEGAVDDSNQGRGDAEAGLSSRLQPSSLWTRLRHPKPTSASHEMRGIGMFDSKGDIPLHPSSLRHTPLQPSALRQRKAPSRQLSLQLSDAVTHGDDSLKALIVQRRGRRRKESLIHSIVMDFKHCLEMDTAAALVLVEIMSTFITDGIEILISGMRLQQRSLLQRGDTGRMISEYVEFFPDLATAVERAETETAR